MDSSKEAVNFKCIIAGNGGVGKTCLLRRYTHGDFTFRTTSTQGHDFVTKNLQKDKSIFRVNFWDCAGQEKFHQVVKTFFKGAHGAVLVFDVSSKDSFEELEGWLRPILKDAREGVVTLIVGNKSDLREDEAQKGKLVSQEEIQEFLEEHEGTSYMECSAFKDKGVAEVFQNVIDKMHEKFYEKESLEMKERTKKPIQIGKKEPGKKKCC